MIKIEKVTTKTLSKIEKSIFLKDTNFFEGYFALKFLPQVIEGLKWLNNKNFNYKKITIDDNKNIKKEK